MIASNNFITVCDASCQEILFLILDVVLNIVIKKNVTSCESPYATPFGDDKMLIQSLPVHTE